MLPTKPVHTFLVGGKNSFKKHLKDGAVRGYVRKALKCSYPLILNMAIFGNNQSCKRKSVYKAIHQLIYNAEKPPRCPSRIK